jgi:hypothetical protein
MADATRQYQPVSNVETQVNAAMTVRIVRDMMDGINNYGQYAGVCKPVFMCSPRICKSHLGTNEERVIVPFTGRDISDGLSQLRVHAVGRLFDGAGTTTWRLYSTGKTYRGPILLDLDKLSKKYSVINIGIYSTNNYQYNVSESLNVVRGSDGRTRFILTAQSSDATTHSVLTNLDIKPIP